MVNLKLGIALFIAILIGIGSLGLEVTDDASEAMLPQSSEWRTQYSSFLEEFPGDQTISVVLKNTICRPGGWQKFVSLHDSLDESDYTTRVLSLAAPESKLITSTESSVSFDSIRDVQFQSEQSRCEVLSAYKPYQERLIDRDTFATYLLVFADPTMDAVSLSAGLKEVIEPFQEDISAFGGSVLVTGEPVMSAEIARLIEVDSAFISVTFAVMLLIVFLLTRSKTAVAIVLGLNVFVLAITYGAMGWLSITLTPATSLVIFLLIPLSTAFVIHAIGYNSRSGEHSSREAHFGFAIAAMSTGIGFAATGFTPAHDIQMMALMGVIGIVATALGVYLFVLPLIEERPKTILLPFGGSHVTTLLGNPAVGYTFLALMLAYTTVGIYQLQFNYSPISNLPASNTERIIYNEAGELFPKLSIPLVIESDDLSSASNLTKMDSLESLLNEEHGPGIVIQSVSPHLKELTSAFSEDEGEPTLPASDHELAQFLLFFEPEDISLYIGDSAQSMVFYVQVPFDTSKDYLNLKSTVFEFLERNDIQGNFVGRVSAFFEAGHRVGIDTLRGLLVSSLIILFVLWLLYRSFPLAIAGIAVNVIPVGAGLATLGFLDIPVEIGSAVVAAIAFGILLDDSMHLLVRVRNLVKSGYDPSTAVHAALRDLVSPIAASTLTICVGYSVLFFAHLNSFNDFALVISTTLILALLSDILVLPILVRRFFRDPLT